MKAEKFIKECTRSCSNELVSCESIMGTEVISYSDWLTPEQALRAVEIAKEEAIQELMADAKSGVGDRSNYIKFTDGTWIDLDPTMQLKPSFDVKRGEAVKVLIVKE